jgi:uncharacterized protein YegP (UPF0339 family)
VGVKFRIFKDISGQFRFHLKAPNGEIIASSEGYSSKQACEAGVAAVKKHAPDAEVEEES